MSLLHDFAIHVVHLGRLTRCTDLSSLHREDQVIFCKSRGGDIFKSSYIMFSPPCLLSIVRCSIYFEFAVELFSIFPALLLALYIDSRAAHIVYIHFENTETNMYVFLGQTSIILWTTFIY